MLAPSGNGTSKEKPPEILAANQKEYVSAALKAGMSGWEIGIVLALAEIKKIDPMKMQSRWMDYKVGIKRVGMEDMRKHGVIITP
jgi:hypothetical protein